MTKLILVRGIPGSGKSTVAKSLTGYSHVEADMFWMEDGEYKFDATMLPQAHAWCLRRTRDLLADLGVDVVVSNTFTTVKELRPYFELAKELGIKVQVITCQSQFGNIHGVPEDTLAKMKARFTYDISELYT
jgi:predicted kinase